MNYFSGNQGTFQNQQNQQKYQPVGFVQSQYKGGISKRSAGPVISHTGYQASAQQQFGQQQAQSFGMAQSGMQQQWQQSGMNQSISSRTGAGPVISRVGYQAGQNNQFNQAQSGFAAQNQQQHSQPVISHAGYTAGQGAQNPVIQATTANFGQQQSWSGASSQQQASASYHPVYQATNAQNSGPVYSHVGYQAGAQQRQF
ncbi:hypothetical protein ABEV74_15820 [Paenibacillus cisolokensis]|jgi:hypothetical protein|uniref:Small, acid-soluble spore protein gamma-type n=1 Tax=Paenibacillus cisolokensis TaxID=1658519 RepID=A0ABQ4MZW0_9BACL|nr:MULTISPECIES: hypothetical protein [Paenibacillus]ALS27424.1 hypothetical protein IJ21_20270 [Paenibacillus sp. 32O-W]GIQ61460.1 hypothetical protein PACILC2_00280 [Paenibacillus cisolokensis]